MIVGLAIGLLAVAVVLGWLLLAEKARVEELQGQVALKENWAAQLEERCLGLENERRLLMAHLHEAKSQEYVGPPRTEIRRIPPEPSLGSAEEQVAMIDEELAKRGIA